MKTIVLAVLIAGAAVLPSFAATTCPTPAAQTSSVNWDSSGNSLLSGSYYFRYVQYWTGDQSGDLSRAVSLYQTITFNSGTWSIKNALELDSAAAPLSGQASPCSFTSSGTYKLAVGTAYGYISNPINPADVIWGAVAANGVFVGASTENSSGYNDLFIAVPAPSSSTAVTASTLTGTYSIAYLNFPDGYVKDVLAAGFQIEPNGPGSLGTINIQAYQGNNSTPVNVPEQASYIFTNGAFVLSFPDFGLALAGQEYLYSSPDGSFVFGGSPSGYDFFIGVQSNTGSEQFSGLFYQAGITETMSASGTPVTGAMQTFQGAFNAVQGNIISHKRILQPLRQQPSQFGYYAAPYSVTQASRSALAFGAGGGYTDPSTGMEYVIGANGTIRIGFGTSPILGISVGLAAPSAATTAPQGGGISPAGIVNAASSAPFTAGISPGELISIYGSNFPLGPGTVTFAGSAPTSLQVSVVISSSNQINVVVPAGLLGTSAMINVNSSAAVWALLHQTTLGIFSQTETGLADADAANASGLITPLNPATAGSTIYLSLTGAGATGVGLQTVAPSTGLSVMIGSTPATATFQPAVSISGVSIATVTIPTGLTPGENTLTISGPDSQSMETTIFIGAASSATSASVRLK